MKKRLKAWRYYLAKCIINNYNVSINVENVYDQPIDSDIKWCKELKKVNSRWRVYYQCLLEYYYNKTCDRLIAVDLSRQKELNFYPKG